MQVQLTQTIYIKAKLSGCTSVLMAATLAFAATVAESMNLSNINSDCEQLAHFPNTMDQSNPPD
jgi:hypothetical protein